MTTGFVSLVGAGPWNPELLTLGGLARLRRADVVIADYLVNPALLLHCRRGAEIVQRQRGPKHGTTLSQSAINDLLVDRAGAGHYVVRLKGGDPCLFGRGAEEAQVLHAAGIPFEFVPGVSSPIAAPQCAGIPVTHRSHTPAVTFVSGFEAYEKSGLAVAWEHLAKSAGTLVLMMSVANARMNAQRLVEAGRDRATPAAVVRWGSRGIQQTLVGTLEDIADRMDAEGIRAPAVLVVGDVVRLRETLRWLDTRPLHGHRVAVTRSHAQAGPMLEALAARGADAVALPCLSVEPPDDPSALAGLAPRLGGAHGLIVSSPNGVAALFEGLAQPSGGPDVRVLAGKVVAAIGEATEHACRAHGLVPDLVPPLASSEGLVQALRTRGELGRHWVHVRGATGRDVLQQAIAEAGGTYDLVVGYRTVRPPLPESLVASVLPAPEGEGLDAICLASGQTARHLLQTLGEHLGDPQARNVLATAKVVTIGPVTTRAVEALGIRVDATAPEPTEAAMVAQVERLLAG